MKYIDKEIIIDKLAESLNITPGQFNEAKAKYERLSEYLKTKIKPLEVYLQGSFELGTVIRPIKSMEEQDFDIDVVCQIINGNQPLAKIKNIIGDVLKESSYSKYLDDEGRRCWTLNYHDGVGDGLHVDILPCVNESIEKINLLKSKTENQELVNTAIKITHKKGESLYLPRTSNPKGLVKWFNNISRQTYHGNIMNDKAKLLRKHESYFRNTLGFSSPIEIDDYFVKTPLQKTVQILKRHRDVMFSSKNNEEYKPISAIITVLVTKIAEDNINRINSTYDLLNIVIQTIKEYSKLTPDGVYSDFLQMENRLIEKLPDGKGWKIENPTNPGENLADRWHEDSNARAKAFFEWVESVHSHLQAIVENQDLDKIKPILALNFGKETAEKTIGLCSNYLSEYGSSNNIQPTRPWKAYD